MGVHEEDLVWLAARVRQINATAEADRGGKQGAQNIGQVAAAGAQEDERGMHAAAGAQEAEKDVQLATAREGALAAPDAAFVRTDNGAE